MSCPKVEAITTKPGKIAYLESVRLKKTSYKPFGLLAGVGFDARWGWEVEIWVGSWRSEGHLPSTRFPYCVGDFNLCRGGSFWKYEGIRYRGVDCCT